MNKKIDLSEVICRDEYGYGAISSYAKTEVADYIKDHNL